MRNTIIIVVIGAMLASCRPNALPALTYVPAAPPPAVTSGAAPPPPVLPQPLSPAPPTLAGPTLMNRIPGGYELRNDRVRVVISDKTGDVIFWGTPTGRNLVLQPGIVAKLTGQPEVSPVGYVEPRDEQTWQFFGPDANHITWRKIYCLDGYNLLASYIYQNDTKVPIDNAVQLVGNLAGVRVQQHAIDSFIGASIFGTVTLQAFNENHNPASPPQFPILLQSDTRHCTPGNRQSFTTAWRLSPPENGPP